jgi:lipopolysaccharide export system ATP-binding protein
VLSPAGWTRLGGVWFARPVDEEGVSDSPDSLAPPSLGAEGEPVLACVGLNVTLGHQPVLRNVELALSAGSVVGVLGPSGAGKTTLFRTLVGELRPDSGRVLMQGRDVTLLPLWARARLRLGYVPQTPSVLLDLTVEQNVRTFVRITGARSQDAESYLERLALGARLALKARDLSGGERRRLELVRALIASPTVLICDEPLTGLDPPMVERVGELLRAQAERGSAVLFADHRIAEVLPFSDEAILLADGAVQTRAPADVFADHPAVRERYLT